jgi:hypothetical protein
MLRLFLCALFGVALGGVCSKQQFVPCFVESDCDIPSTCLCVSGLPVCQWANSNVSSNTCTVPTDSATATTGSCECKIDSGACIEGSTGLSVNEKNGFCDNSHDIECSSTVGGCVALYPAACTCVDGSPICSEPGITDVYNSTCSVSTVLGECECYYNLGRCVIEQVCSSQALIPCHYDAECVREMPCSCDGPTATCLEPNVSYVGTDDCASSSTSACACYMNAGDCNASLPADIAEEWTGTCEYNSSMSCSPGVGGCAVNAYCYCDGDYPVCFGPGYDNPRLFVSMHTCTLTGGDCTCIGHFGDCIEPQVVLPPPPPPPLPLPPQNPSLLIVDCNITVVTPEELARMPPSEFYSLSEGSRDNWICNRFHSYVGGLDFGPQDYLKQHSSAGSRVDWLKLYRLFMSLSVSVNSAVYNPCNTSASELFTNATMSCYNMSRELLQTAFPLSQQYPEFPPCSHPNPQIVASIPIDRKEMRNCYVLLKTIAYSVSL